MLIEVKTTVKKLTKSLVNQMCIAGIKEMQVVLENRQRRIIGFLINIRKGHHKVILVHDGSDYYIVPVQPWEKSDHEMSVSIGNSFRSFTHEQARDTWFDAYTEIVHIGLNNHIYL